VGFCFFGWVFYWQPCLAQPRQPVLIHQMLLEALRVRRHHGTLRTLEAGSLRLPLLLRPQLHYIGDRSGYNLLLDAALTGRLQADQVCPGRGPEVKPVVLLAELQPQKLKEAAVLRGEMLDNFEAALLYQAAAAAGHLGGLVVGLMNLQQADL
jgi:hypothetical protein